jgi:hypothetical protein
MTSILFAIWTATAVWGQFVSSGTSVSSGGATWGGPVSCGPPGYNCSRSESAGVAIADYAPVGRLTGAGTVVVDPGSPYTVGLTRILATFTS